MKTLLPLLFSLSTLLAACSKEDSTPARPASAPLEGVWNVTEQVWLQTDASGTVVGQRPQSFPSNSQFSFTAGRYVHIINGTPKEFGWSYVQDGDTLRTVSEYVHPQYGADKGRAFIRTLTATDLVLEDANHPHQPSREILRTTLHR